MSQFKRNLRARREYLDLTYEQIMDALHARGLSIAYPTVAGWFNDNRGLRWKVDELMALLEILGTDLETMAGSAELVEEPLAAATAREMRELPDIQQQAVLAMVKAMKGVPS